MGMESGIKFKFGVAIAGKTHTIKVIEFYIDQHGVVANEKKEQWYMARAATQDREFVVEGDNLREALQEILQQLSNQAIDGLMQL